MTGYVYVIGPCGCCKKNFSFNPIMVPSHQMGTGTRQPICGTCMTLINQKRASMGLPPHHVPDDAYEVIPEEALP